MIEQITSDNYREFSARYLGTIGFLRSKSNKKIVVSVDEITSKAVTVTDSEGVNYNLNSDTGCYLEFTQVPSQWYQPDENHIVFLTRKPERQWKRGINTENTSMMLPDGAGAVGIACRPTVTKLAAVLTPEEEIGAFATHPEIKCGLWSKYFAWAVNYVWVKDMLIGTVDHKAKEITLSYPQFNQELRDALVRTNSFYCVKG